jgi:hypothetical protein
MGLCTNPSSSFRTQYYLRLPSGVILEGHLDEVKMHRPGKLGIGSVSDMDELRESYPDAYYRRDSSNVVEFDVKFKHFTIENANRLFIVDLFNLDYVRVMYITFEVTTAGQLLEMSKALSKSVESVTRGTVKFITGLPGEVVIKRMTIMFTGEAWDLESLEPRGG